MDKYIIVWSENEVQFLDRVNKKLSNGYVCQGGVSMQTTGGILFLVQAMILKNNQSDPM